MGITILHVMYRHQCDQCGKKKRGKQPLPDGWLQTHEIKVFCSQHCVDIFTIETSRQALLKLKDQYPEAVVDLPIILRKSQRRYSR